MDSKHESTTIVDGRELVLTRVLAAPRELVFKAWVDPRHIVQWWGPRGFTTTTHEMDVRPGGSWRFVMHGPDGRDYPNLVIFQEVVSPARLVYEHSDDGGVAEPVNFRVVADFAAEGNQTRLTMRMIFPSQEDFKRVMDAYGALEGAVDTMARLGEHLPRVTAETEGQAEAVPFVVTRAFAVPRERLFAVWTQREHLLQWWGPRGCTVSACTLDLRPGGMMHYCLEMPGGLVLWGRWLFREITAPERLVFETGFSDAEGGLTRNPWMPVWPLQMLCTVTFLEHGGVTTLCLEWAPLEATAGERRGFGEGFASMQQGWGGTMERLAERLGKC